MPNVLFAYADVKPSFQNKKLLRQFVASLFAREEKKMEQVQYVFCSDSYLLQINNDYLQHDDFTDIITFDLSQGTAIVGEIYISVERVKENAKLFDVAFSHELTRVIFHGALHLCGFKDKKKSEIVEMRAKEEQYLRLFELCIEESQQS